MKKIVLIALCAIFAMVTKAQTNIDELKYLQSIYGMEKKQLVAERMQISKADSAKFWSIYDEYELFRSEISEKRASNVQKFSDNYAKLTSSQADEILKTTFEINDEFAKLLQKTSKTIAKEISSVKAGQFVYLEMYFEAVGRMKLSEILPHIGDTPTMKK